LHELSIGTWIIHISSVLEWISAIFIVNKISNYNDFKKYYWFALAMIPNLIGAMCAITWHLYDNPLELYGLVTLQGLFTIIGNTTLAISCLYIYKKSKIYE
tara:strand:- start:773 stop:1075 length:303 start_codon:yes stop_codon:yes gene_type:complete